MSSPSADRRVRVGAVGAHGRRGVVDRVGVRDRNRGRGEGDPAGGPPTLWTTSTEWETEWLSLDREQLVEFIRSSELTVKDEWDLWQVCPAVTAGLNRHQVPVIKYISSRKRGPKRTLAASGQLIVTGRSDLTRLSVPRG